MPSYKLFLFGSPRLEQDGQARLLPGRKLAALLAYVAATGQPQSRDHLATLFWPEFDQATARANLRRELSGLRTIFAAEHLAIEREQVRLLVGATLWLDVAEFQARLQECQQHAHGWQEVCPACLPLLQAAADLYTADFLAGFSLSACSDFDEWQYFQAEAYRRTLATVLDRLAQGYLDAKQPDVAIAHAQRRLILDPLHEPAQRQLITLYADTGNLTAALRQYERCVQLLQNELGAAPAAETNALMERIQRTDVRVAWKRRAEEPRKQQGIQPNLPIQTTPFVGRTTEIDLIARYLADPACRCLTLVGPGGMGKTRLALESATRQLSHFLHGVVFVPLAAVSAPQLIAPAIAAALHLPLHGQEEPTQQLFHYLEARETLLLLDNLEQLLAGRALLAEILTRSPQVKILVTSRERLNLRAEWVIDLTGLSFPLEETADTVRDYSAMQLFVETARRVQSNFTLTTANAAAIGRICRLVAGMPLGIELAAAWVRTLSCTEIADELARNLDLLTTTQPDVPERHQSMSAVFAHSWGLLPAAQQTLLGQLTVFRRGFRQEAAQQICNASLRDLAALVDKSLLQRDEPQGRFVLHELLRQFAAEKQATTVRNGHQPVAARHCHYYLAWLATHTEALQGEEPHLTVAVILPEIENIRQAWRWAVEQGAWEALGRALPAWRNFYQLRGLYTEAGNWLSEALAHWSAPSAAPSEASSTADPLATIQGWLLIYAAESLVQQARYAQALQRAEVADKVAPQQAAPVLKGQAQAMLGLIRALQKAFEPALAHQQRAAPLLLQSGERRLYAHLLLQMGKTYEQLHQWEQALVLQEEALRLFEALGDGWGCTISWGALGAVHYGAGHLGQALACTQHALARAQALDAQAEIMHYTAEIGRIYWRTRRYPEALEQLHTAVQQASALGLGHRVSDYYRLIGHTYKDLGHFAQAHTYLEQAVQLAQKSNASGEQIGALETLSTLAEKEGNTPRALEYSRRALQVAERIDEPRLLARCLGKVGQLYAKLDQLPLARQWLETAVDTQQALVMRANEPIIPHNLSRLAQVLYQQGEYAAAEGYCQRCLAILHEHGKTMFHSNNIRVEAMLTLARCYYAQGQPTDAIQSLHSLLATVDEPVQQAKIQAVLAQFVQLPRLTDYS